MTIELWSEQARSTDYITTKGLMKLLGIRRKELHIFLEQELFDNALDFIESNIKEFIKLNKKPYIKLIVSKEENNQVTKISVRNSNFGKYKEIFTDDQIKKIFNFDNFYSSKRNQYRIKRGALGDAFKEILWIPYALAVEDSDIQDYEGWKYPLQINVSNTRLIEVRVNVFDKIKQIPKSKFAYIDNNENKEEDYTEISVYIPSKECNLGRILHTFKQYALANPHIDFEADFDKNTIKLSYPSTQNIKNWSNKTSVYYSSLDEFKNLVYGSDSSSSDSLNVYNEFIHTRFREGWIIRKELWWNEFETLTFRDLKRDNSKIEYIYQLLKKNLESIGQRRSTSKSHDLELPFDLNKGNTPSFGTEIR